MRTLFEPQGRSEDANYCLFGAKALTGLLKTLEAQTDGVRKSADIEYVHKMRVASRRMRAAMPLFRTCFPKKRFKKWLKEIKKVTKFLAAARDLDVQIAFIQNYMQNLQPSTNKVSLELLIENHTRQRTAIQTNVVDELEELSESSVLQDMDSFCSRIVKERANEHFDSSAVLEKAYWQISAKLDDFLAMEDWVHKENEILKHHEMRIRAKWLRYTMEAFSPLYEEELSEETKMIKNFQDILGEMHDCDVWIENIPKFIIKNKAAVPSEEKSNKRMKSAEKQLQTFLEYVKQKRNALYRDFVQLWDEKKDKNAFEELMKATSTQLVTEENRIKQIISFPDAKIAVLADVHANLHALEAVIQDAENLGVSAFLNAGDLTGFGAFPNEVIQLLHSKKVLSVIGNYDLEVLDKEDLDKDKGAKKLALDFARKELTKSCAAYLRSLPSKIKLEIDGKRLLMVHGSPESIEEHIYHDTTTERLQQLANSSDAKFILVGHSHEQFKKEVNGVSFINPGSVGRPGDGNPQAAYAVVTFAPFSVEFRRVSYDVEAAAGAIRKKKLPESLAQMLLQGLSLDAIIEEDDIRKRGMEQECNQIVKTARKVAANYWKDPKHSEQVRKLSLRLFDSLCALHRLKRRERCWLECAAILHDIGLSEGTRDHQKTSLKLILNDTQIPFSSVEKRVVGGIARYHRKGFPKEKHYNFATLGRVTKRKIELLSGLLRVADGLDFTHQAIVEVVKVKTGPKKIAIECLAHADPMLEEQAFDKKKDMMEKFFNRRLVLTWKQH